MRIHIPMTLLTLAAVIAFVGLGRWQWERGNAREAQWDQFEHAAEEPLPLGSRSLAEVQRFQRVKVTGAYDSEHQFLLDNRTHDGQAGYEVLTPFVLSDDRVLLVNRGWVPFTGFRERLPDVAFDSDARYVVGRVDELPSAGLASGRAAPTTSGPWPKVTTYPSTDELSTALGRKLEPRIVLLDASAPHGYVRDWHPTGISPTRHWSYAFQWWSFAAAVIVIWVVLSVRRGRVSK
jgi:surfeit locus 1 family protein